MGTQGDISRISGQTVIAQISGAIITVSGNIVDAMVFSGQNVLDVNALSNTTALSGTSLVNIHNDESQILPTLILGYDNTTNAQAFRAVAIDGSGRLEVTDSNFDVRSILSGMVIAKISGEIVKISGQNVVSSMSGNIINAGVSGTVSTSISGNVVKISGEIVVAKISGEIISVDITIADKVSVITASGDYVSISGTVSTSISGNVVQSPSPTLLRSNYSQITSNSGGTQLSSGVITFVSIQNLNGNDHMWIGMPGTNSGVGYLLVSGNEKEISINNLNSVYVFATTSGQYVSYLAEV